MTNAGTPAGKAAFAASLATAIAFILGGTSLALILQESRVAGKGSRAVIWTALLCALLVTLIGFFKITGYLCALEPPLDRWFSALRPWGDGPLAPDRMSPQAALNFLLFGCALLSMRLNNRFLRVCSKFFVTFVLLEALIAILGHTYHVQTFFALGKFTPTSLYASITFLILSGAFFLANADSGLGAILLGKNAGGIMARQLLPAALFIPAALGWIMRQGQVAGFYQAEFGDALFIVGNMVIFTFVVCWSVTSISQSDIRRQEAEEALRLLNSAVLQSQEAILITEAKLDLPGPRIIFVNPAFTRMTGYTAEEAMGKTPRILQGPRTDPAVLSRLRKKLERGEVFEGETINYRKDGTAFDLEWKIAPLRDSGEKITHFVALQRDITKQKRTDARFRRLIDSSAQGVIFWNRAGGITVANDAFLNLVGYTREDLEAGRINWIALTPPEYTALDQHCLAEVAAKGVSATYEKEFIRKDGSRVSILLGAAGFEDNPEEGVCFTLDLTDRKKLEHQLFQSQKLETVGKLAGGIAHEFNSILTAIIGQSELLRGSLPPESPLARNAAEIGKAADRAAALTRQLLAYGRKQILQPEILDLNRVLADMKGTLHHLMGNEVDIRISPLAGLGTVKADAGQIEQVIVNIALNAHDAMPNGGKLTLETANISFDANTVGRYPELKPGDYVMMAIADTGMGMPAQIQARVFEPFFSTKGVGRGTGLGLSTSYGIVKQSGGHISVYSEPGRGSTFKIYLPQVSEELKPPVQHLNSVDLPRGTETILLVEDDPALREMAADLLGRLGYRVLTAADGIEAMGLKQQPDIGHIDLLFTDVVMPHMNGRELSERVRTLSPHTKILFSSAYTENAIVHQGVLDSGVMLLQKPYAPAILAAKVRQVLDQATILAK
jgi:PAS domain S-box-containing protein